MSDYPVGIIGGGISGLTAALTLAKVGRKSIIFESSSRLGGCCASIQRGQLLLEPAASVIIGKSMLCDVFSPLGIEFNHLLKPIQPVVRILWPTDQFDLVGPSESFAESISPWAPGDISNVSHFLRGCINVSRLMPRLLWDWKMNRGFRRLSIIRLIPWLMGSYSSLIRRNFKNPRLRQILESFSDFYAGIPAHVAPAILGILPSLAIYEGCYEIQQGIQHLPDYLTSLLVKTGTEIRLDEPVERIMVHGSSVWALKTTQETIKVSGVIAACDIRITMKLLPPAMKFMRTRLLLKTFRPSVSCISIFGKAENDIMLPPMTWVLPRRNKIQNSLSKHVYKDWKMLPMAAITRGPNRSIRIGGAIKARAHLDWNSVSSEATTALISFIKEAGLDLNLRNITIWTPRDYETQLRLPFGCAFGFAASKWQLGPGRYGPRTPLRNLMVAGQSCFPGFGIPLVALSGRLAAMALEAALN